MIMIRVKTTTAATVIPIIRPLEDDSSTLLTTLAIWGRSCAYNRKYNKKINGSHLYSWFVLQHFFFTQNNAFLKKRNYSNKTIESYLLTTIFTCFKLLWVIGQNSLSKMTESLYMFHISNLL